MITLDASVIVATLIPSSASRESFRHSREVWADVQSGRVSVCQPVHWLAETAGVLARLSPDSAETDTALLHALEWQTCNEVEIWSRAVRLSTELKHHLFDTLYHAVALETGSTMVTVDARYFRKAAELGNIRLLGE